MTILNKVSLRILIFLILLLSVLAFSPNYNSVGSDPIKRIGYAMPSDFTEYSQFHAYSFVSQQWLSSISAGLYVRDQDNARIYYKNLALDEPLISPDKLTYTVNLKSGLMSSLWYWGAAHKEEMVLREKIEEDIIDFLAGISENAPVPGASVTMIMPDGTPSAGSPYTGGGLYLPWGIAVDGNDNVFVANFNGKRLSHLCGANPSNCPPGFNTGDPISPAGGYTSDGLVRNTGVQIDPSGNVWLANNWEIDPYPTNPGGHQLVVFIGLAAPVKTPLIGPPERP